MALTVENDSFTGTMRDGHYTSGVLFSVSTPASDNTWIQNTFDPIIPKRIFGDTIATEWQIGQQVFTPKTIGIAKNQPEDHPWAGFTYMGISRLGQSHSYYDQLSLILGVVGPSSLAEQSQKELHSAISFPTPLGWDHQLHDEITGYLSWQRYWPHLWKNYTKTHVFSTGPYVGTALGTTYRYAALGVMMRSSPKSMGLRPLPQRMGPSHPTLFGIEPMLKPNSKWKWSWFSSLEYRAVEHNLFLDGNTTQESNSVTKRNMLYEFTAGFVVVKEKRQWSYTLVYRGREFTKQLQDDAFAVISLSFL